MFGSFYQRILLVVVGLVVVAQLTTFVAVLGTLDRDVKAETRKQLEAGTGLLLRMFDKRSQLLLNSAEVLAADFGFRSAIASRDKATIHSALNNNLARIDADLASLISLDGTLVSSTYSGDTVNPDVYATMADKAQASGIHIETLVIAEQARQVVVVPVKAPLAIGWLLLGFSLDNALASELASQMGMEVSFSGRLGQRQQYFGSTLSAQKKQAMPQAIGELTQSSAGQVAMLQGEAFLTQLVELDHNRGNVTAYLQKSLQSALQSYRRLRAHLILLASVSLSLAVILGIWMAHSVTRPVKMLSAAAARIKDGHYDTRIDLNRSDELGDLADTFNRMQTGIAKREAHIAHQAYHDELTQLPNMRSARDRLKQQMANAGRSREPVAIIVLGVDRFRQVTQTLGHPIGDQLIRTLAERLQERVREGDTLARIAGDEFMIVANDIDENAVHHLIKDVILRLTQPVSLDVAELVPGFSVGVSLYPQHGTDETVLMRRADIALGDARENMSGLEVYEAGRDQDHLRQLSIIADLKRAVDEDQLIMHYQPKIDMRDKRVRSVEALVRWIHPEHGFMPPDEFIGLAEKSGNISLLSNWILRSVITQVAAWRSEGIDLKSAVNLSAMDLQDDRLPDRIAACLDDHALEPADLIIEVTESAMMRDADKALKILGALQQRGHTVSIDDFGTGYSSLSKLRDLPINELKIDRSFIIDIKPDTMEALIVKAIIDLGHSIGMTITTEGIETRDEWNLLEQLGSDLIQGYFVSRPLSAADLAHWWRAHESSGRQLAA